MKRCGYIRFLVYSVLAGIVLVGCKGPSYTYTHKVLDYPKSAVRDVADTVQAPMHWQDDDWQALAVLGITTGVFVKGADKPIRHYAINHQSKFMNKTTDFVKPFGDTRRIEMFEAGLFAVTYPSQQYGMSDTAFMALEATIFSHTLAYGLRKAIKREGPEITDNPDKLHFNDSYGKTMHAPSFPALDVTAAFSWAAVVSARTEDSTITTVSYGLAGLVGIGEVYKNEHWTSDVWMGAALGMFIGQAVVGFNSQLHGNLGLAPIVEPGFTGAGLALKF